MGTRGWTRRCALFALLGSAVLGVSGCVVTTPIGVARGPNEGLVVHVPYCSEGGVLDRVEVYDTSADEGLLLEEHPVLWSLRRTKVGERLDEVTLGEAPPGYEAAGPFRADELRGAEEVTVVVDVTRQRASGSFAPTELSTTGDEVVLLLAGGDETISRADFGSAACDPPALDWSAIGLLGTFVLGASALVVAPFLLISRARKAGELGPGRMAPGGSGPLPGGWGPPPPPPRPSGSWAEPPDD
jgi:hypothetical protein